MVERARHYRTANKDGLTPRQREVLQMVAAGKTNPEIAEALGITLDGAKFHIREILARLEVDSREEAGGWWKAHGGLRTRIVSALRALSPAAWLKPAAIGTAIGGTTLGLVAIGVAMNGSGSDGELPSCEIRDLKTEVRPAQNPDSASRFELLLWSKHDCRFTGVGWARLVLTGAQPATVTSETDRNVYLDLTASKRVIATATWTDWCKELPAGSFLQFDLLPGNAFSASTLAGTTDDILPVPCGDPNHVSALTIQFETDDPRAPPCDMQEVSWRHDTALDAAAGLRFVWSAESARRCTLRTTLLVSLSASGAPALLSPLQTAPISISVAQELGVGTTPVISGTLSNVCGQAGIALGLIIAATGEAAYMVDAPIPPCFNLAEPARFEARWVAENNPSFRKLVPTTPFVPFRTEPSTTYAVKAGDTLLEIAMAHGVSTAWLLLANPGVSADNLRLGQELRIPEPPVQP